MSWSFKLRIWTFSTSEYNLLVDHSRAAIKAISGHCLASLIDSPRKHNKCFRYYCTFILIFAFSLKKKKKRFLKIGGWNLINVWLNEARAAGHHWMLLREILILLDKCPVGTSLLKENDTAKTVKSLTKDCPDEGMKIIKNNIRIQNFGPCTQRLSISLVHRSCDNPEPVSLNSCTVPFWVNF